MLTIYFCHCNQLFRIQRRYKTLHFALNCYLFTVLYLQCKKLYVFLLYCTDIITTNYSATCTCRIKGRHGFEAILLIDISTSLVVPPLVSAFVM